MQVIRVQTYRSGLLHAHCAEALLASLFPPAFFASMRRFAEALPPRFFFFFSTAMELMHSSEAATVDDYGTHYVELASHLPRDKWHVEFAAERLLFASASEASNCSLNSWPYFGVQHGTSEKG